MRVIKGDTRSLDNGSHGDLQGPSGRMGHGGGRAPA